MLNVIQHLKLNVSQHLNLDRYVLKLQENIYVQNEELKIHLQMKKSPSTTTSLISRCSLHVKSTFTRGTDQPVLILLGTPSHNIFVGI